MHAGLQHRFLEQRNGQTEQPFQDPAEAMTSPLSSAVVWCDGGHHDDGDDDDVSFFVIKKIQS